MFTHEYRTRATAQPGALWRIASARMPTKWGMFNAIGFERDVSNDTQRVEASEAFDAFVAKRRLPAESLR
jgi:hypothetical protein